MSDQNYRFDDKKIVPSRASDSSAGEPILTISLFRDGEIKMTLSHGGNAPADALSGLPELLEDAASRLRERLKVGG